MNKKLFFIWSMCLLALVPLLAGCDKDDEDYEEEEVVEVNVIGVQDGQFIVESFKGTDGMEGEKILFELEDVPAVVRYEQDGYVTIYYSSYADEYFKDDRLSCKNEGDIVDKRIGVTLKDLKAYKIPFNTKVYLSASVTNVIKFHSDYRDEFDWGWGFSDEERMYKKAYLKDIRIRE